MSLLARYRALSPITRTLVPLGALALAIALGLFWLRTRERSGQRKDAFAALEKAICGCEAKECTESKARELLAAIDESRGQTLRGADAKAIEHSILRSFECMRAAGVPAGEIEAWLDGTSSDSGP